MERRILFICDGNKDRSPTAEAIFNNKKGINEPQESSRHRVKVSPFVSAG
jgi:predicted protein tyrosine phosphatase